MKEYLKSIKMFFDWVVKEYKMYKNPIPIKFYNHWPTFFTEKLPHRMWFYRFIEYRKIDNKMTFFSVDGYRWFINYFKGKKVFFTGEYVQKGGINKKWVKFSDNCVNNVNLSLGYDFVEHPNYVRFPLWIMYFVSPEMTFSELKKHIEEINSPFYRLSKREKFVCQISHHDINGIRKKMVNLINRIDEVTCAGSFMNNTNELKIKYNDDKLMYLKNFMFNICPENFSAKGYITEKIFDAIVAGCIPIYWGGGKKEWVEPSILNPKAFLYYEEGKEDELLKTIKELYENKQAYESFIQEPPFQKKCS